MLSSFRCPNVSSTKTVRVKSGVTIHKTGQLLHATEIITQPIFRRAKKATQAFNRPCGCHKFEKGTTTNRQIETKSLVKEKSVQISYQDKKKIMVGKGR